MTVRTRFAPSPTGYLHIGGARTALYCWLYALKNKGKFVLRIEDTDLERSTPEAVQAILAGMDWLGLNYDEGPFYQTKRFDRYYQVIDQLLTEGKAYRCTCSKERLEQLRTEQFANKQKPRYDGHCRNLNLSADNKPFVVRFKNPLEGEVVVNDQVHGKVVFQNTELDDLIIARSDSSPTYNFTVVVDDYDMHITHVIRGDDHLNNAPRQINMLLALGATPPVYAHVPMILGSDGKKLSKRHGAVSVMQYKHDGFLAPALLNYLIRLGWSHGDQEIFSISEMIEYFDIDNLNKSAAAFNLEKLLWLNQHYLKTMDPRDIAPELQWHFSEIGIDTSSGPSLEDVIVIQRERVKTLKEMAEKSRYFFEEFAIENMQADISPEVLPALLELTVQLTELTNWTDESIHQIMQQIVEKYTLKFGKFAQPLRLILTGASVSPSIDSTICLIGKEKVLQRLKVVTG